MSNGLIPVWDLRPFAVNARATHSTQSTKTIRGKVDVVIEWYGGSDSRRREVYYPTEADITALQRFCSSDDPTSPEWYKHRAKLIGLKPELLAQIELLTVPDVLALITTLDCGDPSSDKVDGLDSPPQETRDRLALAYAAYEYAVEKGARRKSASAWDWLHEHGCSDYDLPAKPTFMSYIALHKRSVRKQSTGSHNPTSGRIGRSIQRQAER